MTITNCPKCGSIHNFVKAGFFPSGEQRYKCKGCKYIGNLLPKKSTGKSPEINNQTCLQCGSDRIVKNGKTSANKQIYKCKICGYRGTFLGYKVGKPKSEC